MQNVLFYHVICIFSMYDNFYHQNWTVFRDTIWAEATFVFYQIILDTTFWDFLRKFSKKTPKKPQKYPIKPKKAQPGGFFFKNPGFGKRCLGRGLGLCLGLRINVRGRRGLSCCDSVSRVEAPKAAVDDVVLLHPAEWQAVAQRCSVAWCRNAAVKLWCWYLSRCYLLYQTQLNLESI